MLMATVFTAIYTVACIFLFNYAITNKHIKINFKILPLCVVFAFILRFIDISTDVIQPINQVIKFSSIILGVFIGLKNTKEMGLITGFLVGVLYTILAFLVFSLLNGCIALEPSFVNDIIFGGIAGAIAGVVAVNFKKK